VSGWPRLFPCPSAQPKGNSGSLKPNPARTTAALVMANSASDARHSEAAIRQKLIEENLIYAVLTLPSNMFYTVTLPARELGFGSRGLIIAS
jgi:type I restriction enzyme M protein